MAKSFLQRWRVPIGFATAILFVVFSRPTWRSILIGLPIALAGIALRAWASGHLRKNAELAMSGPYSYTRNPLYLGSFVLALGCAVCGGSFWLGVMLVALFFSIYYPVMQAEAGRMHELFAAEYPAWASQVPLFFPRWTPYRSGRERGFDLQQYLQHREYRALIGLFAVIIVLGLKALLVTGVRD